MAGNVGICGGTVILANCLIVGATEGAGVERDPYNSGTFSLSCTNIWNNAGGDWVGVIADQHGQDGNISLDPWFCDPEVLDLTLATGSPCAPDAVPGCGLVGAWPVACDWPTAAPAALAASIVLAPNAPNPFNPVTTISFALPHAGPARLSIHALDGRLVRRLVDGPLAAGPHTLRWNGCDDCGRPVPSGVYVDRLEVGGRSVARRLTLIR